VPERPFITELVKSTMMSPAERHSEFIADFAPEGARLCEAKMMRIRRRAAADKTWLASDKAQMPLVTAAGGLWERE
jgi:hypothetical protein